MKVRSYATRMHLYNYILKSENRKRVYAWDTEADLVINIHAASESDLGVYDDTINRVDQLQLVMLQAIYHASRQPSANSSVGHSAGCSARQFARDHSARKSAEYQFAICQAVKQTSSQLLGHSAVHFSTLFSRSFGWPLSSIFGRPLSSLFSKLFRSPIS